MTEDDWHKGDDWLAMLAFAFGKSSKRKNILYVCAGLRQIWEWLYSDTSRRAVEVMEGAADGKETDDEIFYARWAAEVPTWFHSALPFDSDTLKRLNKMGAYTEANIDGGETILGDESIISRLRGAAQIAYKLGYLDNNNFHSRLLERLSTQPEWPGAWLVREIYDNPFRPVTIRPEWLVWDGGTIPALAEGIYDERAFNRLPILADALEDAGCDEAVILDHCRQAGDHARGCWVIDSLLGRR